MNPILFSLSIFFIAINLAAFSVMLWDKSRSRKAGAERVSEATIFLLAAAWGSVGVYAGMLLFHHKTRKWQFIVGIPLLMIQNVASLYLVYTYLVTLSNLMSI
ncbi:MAG: DUF1294 domain-containing protein [Candidatus Moranbacteria bacterium]|nr:DUF1294 domain-containing protein [Candidatus Moranbacteria bacterium]